jgi:predicted flap endonuclease-1-like 5' DNA nuclease
MASIIDIEGIGSIYKEKLNAIGVKTTEQLLWLGASPKGREELAADADIPEKLILEWVNLADLMRIRGVGEEYSDLLEEAGVDTVKELRVRNPENLYEAIVMTNKTKKLVRRTPSLKQVKKWVEQAKTLPPMVTY